MDTLNSTNLCTLLYSLEHEISASLSNNSNNKHLFQTFPFYHSKTYVHILDCRTNNHPTRKRLQVNTLRKTIEYWEKRTAKILLGISTIFQYRIFCNISQLNQKNDDICTYKDADYNILFPVYHINNALASCVEICPWKQNVFII